MIVRFAEDLWTDDYRTITDAIVASVATGPHNLARLAEASFERRGDYEALLFEDRWYRSGELFERSCRVAAGLAELGIAPGERVVVTMANSPEVGVLYQALWRAGSLRAWVRVLAAASAAT